MHVHVCASACHMTSTHIAESAHTRNRTIVTRPFSLAEGWGLGTRLVLNVTKIEIVMSGQHKSIIAVCWSLESARWED